MSPLSFNVKIEITNADGLSHTVNVYSHALSSNHAKGDAQYRTQMINPGRQTRVVDVYRVIGPCLTPAEF